MLVLSLRERFSLSFRSDFDCNSVNHNTHKHVHQIEHVKRWSFGNMERFRCVICTSSFWHVHEAACCKFQPDSPRAQVNRPENTTLHPRVSAKKIFDSKISQSSLCIISLVCFCSALKVYFSCWSEMWPFVSISEGKQETKSLKRLCYESIACMDVFKRPLLSIPTERSAMEIRI